jgi:hypothetical protein
MQEVSQGLDACCCQIPVERHHHHLSTSGMMKMEAPQCGGFLTVLSLKDPMLGEQTPGAHFTCLDVKLLRQLPRGICSSSWPLTSSKAEKVTARWKAGSALLPFFAMRTPIWHSAQLQHAICFPLFSW